MESKHYAETRAALKTKQHLLYVLWYKAPNTQSQHTAPADQSEHSVLSGGGAS